MVKSYGKNLIKVHPKQIVNKWPFYFFKWFFLCLFTLTPLSAQSLEKVTLQLRWHHQFQFAGYYAAIEQGYYRDAGLDVEVIQGQPDKKPVIEVLNGNALYGVGNSEVLLSRLQGSPLVALAAIYQHSPSVLLTKKSSGISSPHDLIGRSVMMMNKNIDADFFAMFHNEGIKLDLVDIVPSSYQIDDLIDDKTEAFNSYITNEPYYLNQQGVEYTVINPRVYGIDFYSDILFTTESELANNPERVNAFREASLKGWKYAFENEQEIIELLLTKYAVNKTQSHLKFEAAEIRKLVIPDVVQIGNMNPWRWLHMASTFVDAGMVANTDELEGFDYQQMTANTDKRWSSVAKLTSVTSLFAVVTLCLMIFLYRRAQRELRLRLDAEKTLMELAYTDNLTNLNNRHQFYILVEQAIKNAERSGLLLAMCFIDIDDFKLINDTYGHQLGDQVLKHVASILRAHTRHSDIIARVGGDEFVIVLADITEEKARGLLELIRAEIKQPFKDPDIHISLSASIGLSFYPTDAIEIDDLMHAADSDMYRQKHKN
jgi:diguanylate cyclase (GGDEF)-like protein